MIDDTIQRIEARLRSAENMPEATRADLLNLLATLRQEVTGLPPSKTRQAENIARAADISTAQAVAETRNDESYQGSVNDLANSVREFEGSHPRLVQIVNNIANVLAGLGI